VRVPRQMKHRLAVVALLTLFAIVAVIASACGAGVGVSPPGQSSTPGPVLDGAQLKYALIERLGPRWFCDPDEYPVARGDEAQLAIQRFKDVKADDGVYAAITDRLGLPAGEPSAAQKLLIYRAWKQLNAINLEPVGNERFRFDYLALPAAGRNEGTRTTGIIDDRGAITIEQQVPAGQPPCPICLARATRIATPSGDVAVEDIRVGMEVWSVDSAGRRIIATVIRAGSIAVPPTHRVVSLALADGRTLHASPGHPLADGRQLGDLKPGDVVDGTSVVAADLVAYGGGSTFDLLPSGPTGVYFADGILLGSTLRR
jgi:Hint domain